MMDWQFVVFATGILLIALASVGIAYLLLKKAIFNIEYQKHQAFQNEKAKDAPDKPNRTGVLFKELANSTNNNKKKPYSKEASKNGKQLLVCFVHNASIWISNHIISRIKKYSQPNANKTLEKQGRRPDFDLREPKPAG